MKTSLLIRSRPLGCGLIAGMLLWAGCAKPSAPEGNSPAVVESAGDSMEVELGAAEEVVFSEEDQALIAAQKVCPVGGPLGEHGPPVKVMVGDRAVFVCCEPCRGPLLKDPEKYLAKLDAAMQADAGTSSEEPVEN